MQTTSSISLLQKQGESRKLCMAEVSKDSMKRFDNKVERDTHITKSNTYL